ncbi:MAG: glycosyltransferase, partial [Candidatus Eremiobacterota bacterium]
ESVEPLLVKDREEYNLHKPLRFGFIGGVMPHKGAHVMVEAAQNLPDGSAEFWIYGFISEEYGKILASMDKKKFIKLKGAYKSSDLPSVAKELDAMILPSLWEDCAPLTIVESLAMKVPVIGSNIGGFPDFISDGLNGRLYTYNSPTELNKILREIIDNPELLIKWRKHCVLPWNFDDYINHVMHIYRCLSSGKIPPAETLSFYFLPHDKKLPVLQKQEDIATDSLNRLAFSADLTGGFSNKRAAGKMPSPFPSPLYLNLGCGKDIRDGFVNIDLFSDDSRVVGMDVRKLYLPDNCADGILASDILEHFSHRETGIILREWARVLKPGGELFLRCPSLYLQLKAYWNGIWDADMASYMIFGGQTNPGDYHCTGFDEKSISKHLTSAGLEITSFEEIDTPQDKGFINLNMTVRARKPVNSMAGISEISLTKPVIYWEGSQFVYHSLALINRELSLQLIDRGFDVTIIPYENHQFKADVDTRFRKIAERLTTTLSRSADIHVRHQWPPKFTAPPAGGHWVIIQPWEYGRLRKEWVEPMRELIDEIWIPSNFVRKSYIESGIQPEKVFVIPNGFNPEIFNPSVTPFPVKTDKKFKFLFVGGTIWRKGADVLVNAYIKTFTASDDVSLIIKDIGHDTFYRGMGLGEQLKKIQENPSMPEIIYIKDFLSEKEMAGLYTACDCLLHPYRGEGFAFPVLEAMACGKPVIVTKGGATDDFCKEEFTFHVSAEWKNITFPDMELVGNEGMVLEPSMDSLVKNMRDVYEDYPSAMEKAARALEFVKSHYTWDKIGNILVERVDKLRNKPVLRYEKIKTLMKRGENFFTEGNIDEAMKCFSSIIDIEHSSGKAHSHMATLYWKKQDRASALKHIKEAIKFSPCDADVVWNYGHIMTEKGHKSDAFKAYKEYLSKNPHDAEIKSLFDKLLKEEERAKASLSSSVNRKKRKKK